MRFAIAWVLLAGSTFAVSGAELKPEALAAWNRYIGNAEGGIRARLADGRPFLWTEENAARMAQVRRGRMIVEPIADHGCKPVTDALIHDWIAAVFIPGAGLDQALAVVHNYNSYRDFYKPALIASRDLGTRDGVHRFTTRWQRKVLWVTTALDADYEARDYRVDDHRDYSVLSATSVREIADYGQPTQHELPPNQGNGYVWRMAAIARFDQRDGGVYIEMEAFALTRDIPISMRWLVRPVVAHLARETLETSLGETRAAVLNRQKYSSPAANSVADRGPAPANIRAPRTR